MTALAQAAAAAGHVKESSIGIWFWLVLIVEVNATWIGMDVWLNRNGYEMLTTEFREGLRNPFMGPLLFFLTFGTIAALVGHFFIEQ